MSRRTQGKQTWLGIWHLTQQPTHLYIYIYIDMSYLVDMVDMSYMVQTSKILSIFFEVSSRLKHMLRGT